MKFWKSQYPITNIQYPMSKGAGNSRPTRAAGLHLVAFVVLAVISLTAQAQAPQDRILLRETRTWVKGRLIAETRQGYQFIDEKGSMRVVPKEAVALLDWADPAKGAAFAELDKTRSWAGLKETSPVVFLPTPAFGQDLAAGVAKAKKSIHVLAYNMQGDTASEMTGAFFDTLREKAAAGVEVVMILEFGSGTNPRTKNLVKNFAEGFTASGIQVLYMQEYKVQHKKLVLVDDEVVWLGSANLTLNAMAYNVEMSLRTGDKEVVRRAVADFGELRKRASRDAQ